MELSLLGRSLPHHGFRLLTDEELIEMENTIKGGDLNALTNDEIGYTLEVDLVYPESLQDKHNFFPLAPENVAPKTEWFSSTQMELRKKLGMSAPN